MAGHSRHAAEYAVKAVTAAAIAAAGGAAAATERAWQRQCLPKHLRTAVFPPARP
jgi:hypothetical protein